MQTLKNLTIFWITKLQKKYIENAGFGKVFTTSYDFDTRDNYLFPCFTTTSYTTSYISATNGGKIDTYDDVYYSNKASDVYVETAGALSDAEEKTITNIKIAYLLKRLLK